MHFVVLLSALVACAAGAALNSTKPKQEGRIFLGEEAQITDFPYQAMLKKRGQYSCGAVIIGENWALTAAHCLDNATAGQLVVWINKQSITCGGSPRMVKQAIPHENFKKAILNYDIALLQLASNVDSNRIISLRNTTVPVRTTAVAIGWGPTTNTSYLSDTLLQGTVTIIDAQQCQDAYENLTSTETILCAQRGNKGQNTCAGDSGGALVYNEQLIGIISGGGDCGKPDDPTIFASIPALRDWIMSKLGSKKRR